MWIVSTVWYRNDEAVSVITWKAEEKLPENFEIEEEQSGDMVRLVAMKSTY